MPAMLPRITPVPTFRFPAETLGVCLVALLLAAGLNAEPVAHPVRIIEVDWARVRGPFNRMYNFCVGAGRANEGLRADWQRQLRRVRADCGFRYIRFHGLFCDDMGVYQEDKQGRALYNWQYVDELFDFLQGIGMKRISTSG
jgi:xylan 1,4-beta-xylosidase